MSYEEIKEFIKSKCSKEEIKQEIDKLLIDHNIDNLILIFYNLKSELTFEEIEKLQKSIIELDPENLKVTQEQQLNEKMDYDDLLYYRKQEIMINMIKEKAELNYQKLLQKGKFVFIDPKPEEGFYFGAMMYIPNGVENYTTLMMHCCNSPTATGIKSIKEANDFATYCNINDEFIFDLSNESKLPFFMPILPRINGFNTQIHNEFVENGDKEYFDQIQLGIPKKFRLSEEEKEKLIKNTKNLDTQIENMVSHCKDVLKLYVQSVSDKIIVEGFSAGSIFATKFINNKSNLVGGAIIGGNSGIYDIQNDDIIKSYYNGEKDNNNPADKKYNDTFSEKLKAKLEDDYKNNVKEKEKLSQNEYQIKKQKERLNGKKNTIYKIYDEKNHKNVQKTAIKDQIEFAKNASKIIKLNETKKKLNQEVKAYQHGFTNIIYISIILMIITILFIILK